VECFGHSGSLSRAQWPEFNADLARDEEIEIAIQVNGRLRSRIFANADASDAELREAAIADEKVKAAIEGRIVARIITVPRKLVNVVLQ
jgi:leucyl-tRNA synthetase